MYGKFQVITRNAVTTKSWFPGLSLDRALKPIHNRQNYVVMFYEIDKLLSYNALLNFIIAERGVGKTYTSTKFAISQFLKNGDEFVYLRRYQSELDTAAPKFFDALINNHEFEDHALTVKGNTFLVDGITAGYSISLSTANILKSTSFAKVKTIIFDEFIIDRGAHHYLRNEVEQLLDIIETIGRLRDIRVIFLGNAISIGNPYFAYFNLSLPYQTDFKTFKDGLIVVNYVTNLKYREAKKRTKFGRLIDGTPYGRYAVDNEWLRDTNSFLRKKSGECRNYSILKLHNQTYGVWRDKDGHYFISTDYDPNNPCIFALTPDDHNEASYYTKSKRNPWFRPVIIAYTNGTLFFETQQIKIEVMRELIKFL